MRVRRLLFLLVPFVLGGTTPVHAALGPLLPYAFRQAITQASDGDR